ncbi:MAG: hypothetical protein R6W74_06755 [Nitrosomonas halophila]
MLKKKKKNRQTRHSTKIGGSSIAKAAGFAANSGKATAPGQSSFASSASSTRKKNRITAIHLPLPIIQ